MKNRVITAIILLALIIPPIFIGGIAYLIVATLILALSTHELLSVNKSPFWVQIIAIAMVIGASIYSYLTVDNRFLGINALFIVLPFFTFFTIAIFDKKRTLLDAVYNSSMTTLVSIFALALMELRLTFDNVNLFLYVLLTNTAVDTCALFVGCKFGKHKLNPRISPKKSIEGAIGGIVGGLLIGTLFGILFPIATNANSDFINIAFEPNFSAINILNIAGLTAILTIIGQIGDLAFSMIKRHFEVKDFSNILPGHGGFGDRIDSTCFNAITVATVLSIFMIL